MPAMLNVDPKRIHILRLEGGLRVPVTRVLRNALSAILRRGERRIVLDLSGVSRMDAAGVGELIRAYNVTTAMNGALRIVNTTAWVREMLDRAHLLHLLSGEAAPEAGHDFA